MNGYQNRIAYIDLTLNNIEFNNVPVEDLYRYMGGRGLGIKLLYDLLPENTYPLSPENLLIFTVGPTCGTFIPASSRWNVTTKSPLTGILGSGNAGGSWGSELKWAGYDGIVIKGKAEVPSILVITDDHIELIPAGDIWGKNTWETEDSIRSILKDPRYKVVSIGPPGEKLVQIANLICDKVRAAGRGGIGAVMGSKNLKAIAVKGTAGVSLYDPGEVKSIALELLQRAKTDPAWMAYTRNTSMNAFLNRYAKNGGLGVKNHQFSVYEYMDRVNHEVFIEKYKNRAKTCQSCPLCCSHVYVINEGKWKGVIGEAPQSATLQGFGARCLLSDFGAVLTGQALVDQYGLDLLSTEAIIAFAFECYQRNLITKEDTGGIELAWGNADAVHALIHLIANNEGIGKLLGRGVKAAAAEIGGGSESFALHVKGQEITNTDPRAVKSWGLAYAVSSRGADHMRAYAMIEFGNFPEQKTRQVLGDKSFAELEQYGYKGKGKLVAYFENMRALNDSLEMCKFFYRNDWTFEESIARIYSAVTGMEMSPEEALLAGERIVQLERLFNLREGLEVEDDTLPPRIINEPLVNGPAAGEVCDPTSMLQEYYKIRDWDVDNGYPSVERLQKLGLANSLKKKERAV
jgi:aldehyde:ferredoxin oxidoreductase